MLKKADFRKYDLSLALSVYSFKQSFFSMKPMLFTNRKIKLAISISLPSAMDKWNSMSLTLLMPTG